MAEQSWWQRAVGAIHREYERRVRRASLVTEYGAAPHGHAHAEHDHPEEEAAEIVNVPRGTRVGRQARPAPPADHEQPPPA